MKSCSICQRVNDPAAVTCVACGEGSWDETHVTIAPSKPVAPEPVAPVVAPVDPPAPVLIESPVPSVLDDAPRADVGPGKRRGR